MPTHAERVERHAHLSERLSRLSDEDLLAWRDGVPASGGWGSHRVLELDGVRVFAKSLLITERERDDPLGTTNRFGLPPFYSYGVGSAGFGSGREVALHEQTTRWVLSGACVHFPITHHHRVLPAGPHTPKVSMDQLDAYVQRWGGSPAVRALMEARRGATMEHLVVMEHVPHVLHRWFGDRPDAAPRFVEQLMTTARFLAAQGVVHFDAHGGNILTDGENFLLTDFGLGLSRAFSLTAVERAFLDRHRHYDRGLLACGLLLPLAPSVRALPEASRAAITERFGGTESHRLVGHIRALVEEEVLDLPEAYVDTIAPCAEVIHTMVQFFRALEAPDKSAHFPDAAVARALQPFD